MPVWLFVVIFNGSQPETFSFRCVSPESAFDLLEKIGDVDEYTVIIDGEVLNAS